MSDDRPKLNLGVSTWREWGERINANSLPADPDDTPVLAGQTGPRRRATREELIHVVEEENARYAREHRVAPERTDLERPRSTRT